MSEVQEMVCQSHKLEIIALDLDTSEKGQFQYMCCNCLVEKMNNNKISTIEQTKDRISSLRTQKKENKTKEIQMRLDYFKNILDQIMDFKITVENNLEKIYSQIKAQIHTVQQEKQSLLDGVQISQNFQDDFKSLSEFLSSKSQDKQIEFQQDSQFIDQIFKQFELLFNNASYFQTIDSFKDAKQKINEIRESIKIELMLQQNNNNQKTPSLNKICPTHKKEIIMIDIDTKKKNIEDRFLCVDCISDHPHCQYRTIEKVNQEWNYSKQQQDRVLNDLKLKRQEKQEKLNQQIAQIRKNYNQQLNEISEKLITEFSIPINKTVDICKFKQTSLQILNNEELVSNISYLIQYDKENQFQDSKIEYIKTKDILFLKEIENKLEHLKLHNQIDIQESLSILQEENEIQGIILLFQQFLESKEGNYEQLMLKQELEELQNSSKQIYCYQGLLNQTIHKFQEHLIKINNINNKMKQISDHINLTCLQKGIQDYTDKFQNDFQQLKKFCDNENLENKLNALQVDYEKLELEYKKRFEDQNNTIDQLKEFQKSMQLEFKKSDDEKQLFKVKLIEEQNNYVQQIQEEQLKNENQIQELNQKLSQKNILISQVQKELDQRIQMLEPIIKLKPNLLKDDYWIKIFYNLQEKTKKIVKQSVLIFQGTKDGLNSQQYWNKVNGKTNLLMVFQSKSDYIFGAYSPCKWESCNVKWVEDNTLSSFIFSQTHDQVYPLKSDYKQSAILCNSSYGPIFGGGNDIQIKCDFTDGHSHLGYSYQFNQQKNGSDDPYLFGQNKPEIKECEIYELQFV